MAYQVYFADLTEESRALMLTLLRLKAEGGTLEPGEAELLAQLRSYEGTPPEIPGAFNRGPGGRRRPTDGQSGAVEAGE